MSEGTEALEPYRGKAVLVLGATGFVGRWVCRLLSRCGADLTMAARDPEALASVARAYRLQGRSVTVDIADPDAVPELIRQCRPVVTFNLAGYGVDPSERRPDLMSRLNVDLPVELAQCVARERTPDGWRGLALVQAGSAFEYGVLQGFITEESEPQPNTPYGEAKLEATRRIRDVGETEGLPVATARLTTVYGPGEHPHRLLPSLLRTAETGDSLELTSGEQERDFTYVEDAALGLLRLGTVSAVPGAVVNLCTGRRMPVKDFVMTAAAALGLREDQIRLGALTYRTDEVWQGPLSTDRLEGLLGWKPATTPAAGVRATRDFLAEQGVTA